MPPTIKIEKEFQKKGYKIIAGLDEAGKGSWAGPVVAAAIILPEKIELPKLNDSKLLSEKVRLGLYKKITQQAISYGVGVAESAVIDEFGLAKAHRFAMEDSLRQLSEQVDFVLLDGKGIKVSTHKFECIVKGDQKVRCISAASIIAKVVRDKMMKVYDEEFPGYGFSLHKGYGTKFHQDMLNKLGPCDIHRKSYQPIQKFFQTQLFS